MPAKYISSLRRTLALCGALAVMGPDSAALAQESTTDGLLETVIVTASRVPSAGQVLPTAWSALDQTTIERIAPQHSNQVFNRIAGSWVSRGNGQESLISLRSPVLTGAGSCGSFPTEAYIATTCRADLLRGLGGSVWCRTRRVSGHSTAGDLGLHHFSVGVVGP